MPTPEKAPSRKFGPKPKNGQPAVKMTAWTTPNALAAIHRWTEESQALVPRWSTGDTLAAMVAVCEGTQLRPVALKSATGAPASQS
jgi:hypothetical protein